MVKSSGADCLREALRLKYAERAASASPASLLTALPSGNEMCTAGDSLSLRGVSTNFALQLSRPGNSFTLFALPTLRVRVYERIGSVAKDSSSGYLNLRERFSPHRLDWEAPQFRYSAHHIPGCHVSLLVMCS
jgi:hypothetical protein